MRVRCRVKKDDKVRIISGKDKGKVGKVLSVNNKKGRILVENINLVKKHVKPTSQNRQGGIVESEAFIDLSNVMLICNKCVNPVRVKIRFLDDGKKIRICKKCDEIVDG